MHRKGRKIVREKRERYVGREEEGKGGRGGGRKRVGERGNERDGDKGSDGGRQRVEARR